jgi:hypothetical protein
VKAIELLVQASADLSRAFEAMDKAAGQLPKFESGAVVVLRVEVSETMRPLSNVVLYIRDDA